MTQNCNPHDRCLAIIASLSTKLEESCASHSTASTELQDRPAKPIDKAVRYVGGTNLPEGTATQDATIGTLGSATGEHREYQFPSGSNLIPGEEALTGRLCQKPTEHTGTASTATGSSAVTYIVPPNPIIMRGGHRSDRVVTQTQHSAPCGNACVLREGLDLTIGTNSNVSRSFAGRTEALKAKSTSGPNALNV